MSRHRPTVTAHGVAALAAVGLLAFLAGCTEEPGPGASPTAARLAPQLAISGSYAVIGSVTAIEGKLVGEDGMSPVKVGDPIPSGDWTIAATCPGAGACIATVVSSSGRRYRLTLSGQAWAGASEPATSPCLGPAARVGQSVTEVFDVALPAPDRRLAAPPNDITGHQTRHYTGCGGTTTLDGTLTLTRTS